LAQCFEEGGSGLTFWPSSPARLAFVSSGVLVPFLFGARLFQDNVQHGQINIMLLFLCLLAFVLFRERRPIAGAGALALAASLKAVPVLLLGYLGYKRAWRELGWTIGFLALLNVGIPVVTFGLEKVATLWHEWRAVASTVMATPATHYPDQALLSALERVLTVQGGETNPVRPAIAAWSLAAAVRVFWVVAALGALGLAVAFRRNPRDLRDRRCAGEFAICLGAMTLVSPLAWTAHFVTLVAPATVVWRVLRQMPPGAPGRAWRRVLWGASFSCLTLSASGFVGWRWTRWLESLSVITVGALLLLAVALSVVPRLEPRDDSA
jgi:hypothetical protein